MEANSKKNKPKQKNPKQPTKNLPKNPHHLKKKITAGVESADKWWNKKDYALTAFSLMEVLARDGFSGVPEKEGRVQKA